MKIIKIFVLIIIIAGAILVSIRLLSKGHVFKMSSSSMEPTIHKGEYVVINKDIYKNTQPQRGDMVVYIFPPDPNKQFVHRVAGLPNETIEIKNIKILINGIVLDDPQFLRNYYSKGKFANEDSPMKIPSNCYFVLGDNSLSSFDSRYWGCLPRENIIGKITKQ